MKLTKIEMGPHYVGYGEGAKPGIKCELEFRVPGAYSTFSVKLTAEQTRDVVAYAADMAMQNIIFDPDTIDVVGSPGVPRPERVSEVSAAEDMPL